MPTGSKYSRVDPVLENHRYLLSETHIKLYSLTKEKNVQFFV